MSLFNFGAKAYSRKGAAARVAAVKSERSNQYLYPAMRDWLKLVKRNHGIVIDPYDNTEHKVAAVVELADGRLAAWLDEDTFVLKEIGDIKNIPIITVSTGYQASNNRSLERNIRHFSESHGDIVVSWFIY